MVSRTICWFSRGAASAVATKLTLKDRPDALPVLCETGSEHPDNDRFAAECEAWFSKEIVRLKSDKYADTWAVWEARKYLSGIDGAPCTHELKVKPRLEFQKPDDLHVFGYTADSSDVRRAGRLRQNYPQLLIDTPLIDKGIKKVGCIAIVKNAGLTPPLTYELGFPNANCLPCVKATSAAYWALMRKRFPHQFYRMVGLSRKLGARLARYKGERVFIDEIPADHPTTDAIIPSCDFLCGLAEMGLNDETETNEQRPRHN